VSQVGYGPARGPRVAHPCPETSQMTDCRKYPVTIVTSA